MSNLIPQASISNSDTALSSNRPVFFEDSFESSDLTIYELLNLSAIRQGDSLEERIAYRNEFVRFIESDLKLLQPMAFSWELKGQSFESTSLLFELYMTTLAVGESLLRNESEYKEANMMFSHAEQILEVWKTSDLVYPACPHVCTKEYLRSLSLLTKSALLLKEMRTGSRKGVALSSAMQFAGKVPFHIADFSEAALSHYLASSALR